MEHRYRTVALNNIETIAEQLERAVSSTPGRVVSVYPTRLVLQQTFSVVPEIRGVLALEALIELEPGA